MSNTATNGTDDPAKKVESALAAPTSPPNCMERFTKIFGNLAQIATTFIAAIALLGAFFQLQAVRSNAEKTAAFNREADARRLFQSQVRFEFENPKFTAAKYDELKKDGDAAVTQYHAFVVHLLFVCEEIMGSMPDDPGWREGCQTRIENHIRFICDDLSDEDIKSFNMQIRLTIKDLVEAAKAGKVNGAEECKQRSGAW
jgi:hypothetical protein